MHELVGGGSPSEMDFLGEIFYFSSRKHVGVSQYSRRYTIVMGTVLACVIGIAFMGTAFAVKARIDDAGHDAVAS